MATLWWKDEKLLFYNDALALEDICCCDSTGIFYATAIDAVSSPLQADPFNPAIQCLREIAVDPYYETLYPWSACSYSLPTDAKTGALVKGLWCAADREATKFWYFGLDTSDVLKAWYWDGISWTRKDTDFPLAASYFLVSSNYPQLYCLGDGESPSFLVYELPVFSIPVYPGYNGYTAIQEFYWDDSTGKWKKGIRYSGGTGEGISILFVSANNYPGHHCFYGSEGRVDPLNPPVPETRFFVYLNGNKIEVINGHAWYIGGPFSVLATNPVDVIFGYTQFFPDYGNFIIDNVTDSGYIAMQYSYTSGGATYRGVGIAKYDGSTLTRVKNYEELSGYGGLPRSTIVSFSHIGRYGVFFARTYWKGVTRYRRCYYLSAGTTYEVGPEAPASAPVWFPDPSPAPAGKYTGKYGYPCYQYIYNGGMVTPSVGLAPSCGWTTSIKHPLYRITNRPGTGFSAARSLDECIENTIEIIRMNPDEKEKIIREFQEKRGEKKTKELLRRLEK